MKQIFLTLSILFGCSFAFAQDTTQTTDYYNKSDNGKSFHFGLYLGVLMANQSSAEIYDGYGFDIDGNKNNWDNSWMKQKIIMENGGGYYSGQPDLIAQELKVDPYTWSFNETDMPQNMRYNPAFSVGASARYSVDANNAVLFNLNVSKLIANGNFTITTPVSQSGSNNQTNTNPIRTFAIRGEEQRMIVEVGYQHLFIKDKEQRVSFMFEGGLISTLAQFSKNEILINNLKIDLLALYNQNGLTSLPVKRPWGIGFGAYGGLGFNANMSEKATIQLIYTPSLERVNMGYNPSLKLQNAIGLRMYYNM